LLLHGCNCGYATHPTRERVMKARELQARRFGDAGIYTNARMDAADTVRR
jgi:predicted ATPase with chaperone activity